MGGQSSAGSLPPDCPDVAASAMTVLDEILSTQRACPNGSECSVFSVVSSCVVVCAAAVNNIGLKNAQELAADLCRDYDALGCPMVRADSCLPLPASCVNGLCSTEVHPTTQ